MLISTDKGGGEIVAGNQETRFYDDIACLAADWSAHKLASMKRNSANYTFQAEQDLVEFQDGLIAWHARPSQAKKLFAADIADWKYEGGPIEDDLVVKQREWAAQQKTETLQTS